MGPHKSAPEVNYMSEELEVVGLVQHKNEDTAKGKYGIKLNDEWYNGFGVLPDYVDEGAKIKIRYFNKKVGDKIYHNVVDGGINQADEKDPETPTAIKKETQSVLSGDWKSADKVTQVDNAVDFSATTWNKCYEAIGLIIKHPPAGEEIAAVNSMFIEVNKIIWGRK
jgi:hypothetical protein